MTYTDFNVSASTTQLPFSFVNGGPGGTSPSCSPLKLGCYGFLGSTGKTYGGQPITWQTLFSGNDTAPYVSQECQSKCDTLEDACQGFMVRSIPNTQQQKVCTLLPTSGGFNFTKPYTFAPSELANVQNGVSQYIVKLKVTPLKPSISITNPVATTTQPSKDSKTKMIAGILAVVLMCALIAAFVFKKRKK